jgi:2-polyprenyl-3-methyl-5-hydroxy-6-metoxy-1,4-benzoquinol methylase
VSVAANPRPILTETANAEAAPANAYEVTPCPACAEPRGESIFDETCEGVHIEIRLCARCGLGYSTPRPTEAYKIQRYAAWARDAARIHTEAHYDHRQQLRHVDLYRSVMQHFDRRIGRGRILDVGCAGGLFLALAAVYASEHNAGFHGRYQPEGAGFDPGEIELARRIGGVPVHRIAGLAQLEDARYDGITLLNVLEHVNEPLPLLRELRRLLRPGGALLLVVPNNALAFGRLRRGIGAQPASFAASEHILHFRPAPLRRLLVGAGFAKVQMATPIIQSAYGSLNPVPVRHRAKHAAYRVLDLLTAQRVYLYPEIVAMAT